LSFDIAIGSGAGDDAGLESVDAVAAAVTAAKEAAIPSSNTLRRSKATMLREGISGEPPLVSTFTERFPPVEAP
jgi:hypothetical protein